MMRVTGDVIDAINLWKQPPESHNKTLQRLFGISKKTKPILKMRGKKQQK